MPRGAKRVIDLRSDTVTQPTDEMREAMARAEVGDDVYGEDPTVNRLEALAAERLGKDAAVFMPTGTMVNQAAVWVHTNRQGAMLCDEGAHIHLWESGGPALLSGVSTYTVRGTRGVFTPSQLGPFFQPPDIHNAPIRLVEIENTHNRAGGVCWTPTQAQAIADFCRQRNIPLHVDGARIFNAAVALGVGADELAAPADSVGFCLSKGLSAPVGSLLCGTPRFIEEARRVRKVLGGGWRQAGILAAAGIVALEKMVDRLSDDHDNARRLAQGLAKIPGIRVELENVQTNIVMMTARDAGFRNAQEFCDALAHEGILSAPRDYGDEVRLVTHRHILPKDVDNVLDTVRATVETRAAETAPRAKG